MRHPGWLARWSSVTGAGWALRAIDGLGRTTYAHGRRLGLLGSPSPPLARHGGSGADHRDSARHRLGHLAGAVAGVLPGLQPLSQVLSDGEGWQTPLHIIVGGG